MTEPYPEKYLYTILVYKYIYVDLMNRERLDAGVHQKRESMDWAPASGWFLAHDMALAA
jgi:hypothetical protein